MKSMFDRAIIMILFTSIHADQRTKLVIVANKDIPHPNSFIHRLKSSEDGSSGYGNQERLERKPESEDSIPGFHSLPDDQDWSSISPEKRTESNEWRLEVKGKRLQIQATRPGIRERLKNDKELKKPVEETRSKFLKRISEIHEKRPRKNLEESLEIQNRMSEYSQKKKSRNSSCTKELRNRFSDPAGNAYKYRRFLHDSGVPCRRRRQAPFIEGVQRRLESANVRINAETSIMNISQLINITSGRSLVDISQDPVHCRIYSERGNVRIDPRDYYVNISAYVPFVLLNISDRISLQSVSSYSEVYVNSQLASTAQLANVLVSSGPSNLSIHTAGGAIIEAMADRSSQVAIRLGQVINNYTQDEVLIDSRIGGDYERELSVMSLTGSARLDVQLIQAWLWIRYDTIEIQISSRDDEILIFTGVYTIRVTAPLSPFRIRITNTVIVEFNNAILQIHPDTSNVTASVPNSLLQIRADNSSTVQLATNGQQNALEDSNIDLESRDLTLQVVPFLRRITATSVLSNALITSRFTNVGLRANTTYVEVVEGRPYLRAVTGNVTIEIRADRGALTIPGGGDLGVGALIGSPPTYQTVNPPYVFTVGPGALPVGPGAPPVNHPAFPPSPAGTVPISGGQQQQPVRPVPPPIPGEPPVFSPPVTLIEEPNPQNHISTETDPDGPLPVTSPSASIPGGRPPVTLPAMPVLNPQSLPFPPPTPNELPVLPPPPPSVPTIFPPPPPNAPPLFPPPLTPVIPVPTARPQPPATAGPVLPVPIPGGQPLFTAPVIPVPTPLPTPIEPQVLTPTSPPESLENESTIPTTATTTTALPGLPSPNSPTFPNALVPAPPTVQVPPTLPAGSNLPITAEAITSPPATINAADNVNNTALAVEGDSSTANLTDFLEEIGHALQSRSTTTAIESTGRNEAEGGPSTSTNGTQESDLNATSSLIDTVNEVQTTLTSISVEFTSDIANVSSTAIVSVPTGEEESTVSSVVSHLEEVQDARTATPPTVSNETIYAESTSASSTGREEVAAPGNESSAENGNASATPVVSGDQSPDTSGTQATILLESEIITIQVPSMNTSSSTSNVSDFIIAQFPTVTSPQETTPVVPEPGNNITSGPSFEALTLPNATGLASPVGREYMLSVGVKVRRSSDTYDGNFLGTMREGLTQAYLEGKDRQLGVQEIRKRVKREIRNEGHNATRSTTFPEGQRIMKSIVPGMHQSRQHTTNVKLTSVDRKNHDDAKVRFYIITDDRLVEAEKVKETYDQLSVSELSSYLTYPVAEPIQSSYAEIETSNGDLRGGGVIVGILAAVASVLILALITAIVIHKCKRKRGMQKDEVSKAKEVEAPRDSDISIPKYESGKEDDARTLFPPTSPNGKYPASRKVHLADLPTLKAKIIRELSAGDIDGYDNISYNELFSHVRPPAASSNTPKLLVPSTYCIQPPLPSSRTTMVTRSDVKKKSKENYQQQQVLIPSPGNRRRLARRLLDAAFPLANIKIEDILRQSHTGLSNEPW